MRSFAQGVVTDEGYSIEEGRERKRRKLAVTESSLRALGWHDGVHGLAPDPVWAEDEEYRRGLYAARKRLSSIAEGEAEISSEGVWLWGAKP
jgi:hypothetical protein